MVEEKEGSCALSYRREGAKALLGIAEEFGIHVPVALNPLTMFSLVKAAV